MGVAIEFPNFTLECGYFGFKALRDKIVKMVPHKRFQEAHEDFENHLFMFDPKEKKKFLYETAPVSKVTGFFMYDHYFSLVLTGEDKPRDGADVLLDRGCVPLDELKKYAGRKKEIFGWKFYKVRKFDSPKSLEDFGLKRPLQSWCYTELDVSCSPMDYARSTASNTL